MYVMRPRPCGRLAVCMQAPGTLLNGRYRLGPPIGEGGMAIVYRAHDETLDRNVAVKILRPQYGADRAFVRRFRQEARSAASLSHPGIAPVFDTGVDAGRQYIVMALVEGQDLERVLAAEGPLPPREALRIGADVADALQAAHDAGIVHRDVKPANIIITATGEVRVVDFGIARALGHSRTTQSGLLVGSVQYVSPEQVLNEAIGPRSDVYSLGIVLYEMLTGIRPFDGPAPVAVAVERLRSVPPSPGHIRRGIPRDVDALVMRAIERDPADRFPSARTFADALRGVRDRRSSRGARALAAAGGPGEGAALGATGSRRAPGLKPQGMAAASVSSAPGSRPRRERRRPMTARRRDLLRFLPLGVVLGLAIISLPLLGGMLGGRGGTLGETASARPSEVGGGPAAGASATPSPETSPTIAPTPIATATPAPTPVAVQPTLPPAIAPPATPVPATAAPVTGSPTEVVARFYELVVAGDFDAAAGLWSDRMRAEYPPEGYIDGRFAPTTRIDLLRNDLVDIDEAAGTATVAVDLVEYRSSGPSPRRFVGQWDLIRTPDGWRMDEPHF